MADQLKGGCFCGAIRYVVTSKPRLKAQCHCRACQYFSGGGPNYYMLVSPESLTLSGDAPGTYRNPNKPDVVTRAFCQKCGTHLTTKRPGLKELVLKVGTLDDPSVFRGPKNRNLLRGKAGLAGHSRGPTHVPDAALKCLSSSATLARQGRTEVRSANEIRYADTGSLSVRRFAPQHVVQLHRI